MSLCQHVASLLPQQLKKVSFNTDVLTANFSQGVKRLNRKAAIDKDILANRKNSGAFYCDLSHQYISIENQKEVSR